MGENNRKRIGNQGNLSRWALLERLRRAAREGETPPARPGDGPMIQVRVRVEPLGHADLPWLDRLSALGGQLTIFRIQAEQGLPISVECLARAERLARSL